MCTVAVTNTRRTAMKFSTSSSSSRTHSSTFAPTLRRLLEPTLRLRAVTLARRTVASSSPCLSPLKTSLSPSTLEEMYNGSRKTVSYEKQVLGLDGRTIKTQQAEVTIYVKPGMSAD
eukprot:CAMPEP_0170457428 /NCGR_PEP_ID=MMETSP0123-20130129/4719_1 /TAXON_ID=182087 /ORGANISM="Favella ehrenbergii, Strain Fehren 1" /LENGTH=116 /DNA_ID=CAMNT_0010721209 /DNA_START=208 /DNA_END=558 /DNA_ORIENTATION=+